MIDRARFKISVGAVAGAASLLAAAPAAAAPVPYTATTGLPALHVASYSFPVSQLNDGIKSATALNGFGSTASNGDIVFEFAGPTDLTELSLWNNIVVDSTGGITSFSLEFLGVNDVSLGQPVTYSVPPSQVAPSQISLSRHGVRKVRLHVISAQTRIELREVEFQGTPTPKPGSFTTACNEVQGLGFSLTESDVTRTSNPVHRAGALSFPQSYPFGPARPYNDAQINRLFIDSFPLVPDPTRNVCQVRVTVVGSSGAVGNNDSANVFLPRAPGRILNAGAWNTNVGSVLLPGKPLTDNAPEWIYNLTISSANAAMRPPLAAALLSGSPRTLDVVVQDDSAVRLVRVAYTLY